MNNRIIVVAGPTASGKTSLGIRLARALGGEIVSADSMQVYRGMDIGTAKADAAEQAAVRHHMIDIADPSENYSVARYVDEASSCCNSLFSAGIQPIVVGGTGLYIDSLLSGTDFADSPADSGLRTELSEEYDSLGGEYMLEKLREVDPARAALLHAADKKRILRALEVFTLTGQTITEHDRLSRLVPPRFQSSYIVLSFRNRELLYERIDSRVDYMIQAGLFEEVSSLLDRGFSPDATAFQAIGYKEAVQYLRGDLSMDEAAALIKQSSRRYAKRQITWFSRREDAFRIYADENDSDNFYSSALDFIAKEGG